MKHINTIGELIKDMVENQNEGCDSVIGTDSHEFNVWTDQYAQQPVWDNKDGLAVCVRNEVDRHIVQNIIKLSETSGTNNSLMVYTSGVNRTNIEDRTMNTQEALTQIESALFDLRHNLRNEVRKVGGTLITADVDTFIGAPKVDAEMFSDAWYKQSKHQNEYLEAVSEGKIPAGFELSLRAIQNFNANISMSPELLDAMDEFEDFIEETYVYPMQKLKAKRAALRKMREAERQLDRS